MNYKEAQGMSCAEIYNAYDFSEKQQRKWLVKIARHWLKDLTNTKLNKITNDTLEVVERYINGHATQKELEDAHAAVFNFGAAAASAAYAASASGSRVFSDAFATANSYFSAPPIPVYKKFLLEVINEMDELERIIRKKS